MNAKPKSPDVDSGEELTDDIEIADSDQSQAEDGTSASGEIDALRQKAEENWNLYLRAAAEAQNIRKRAARDVENARRYALENFSRELLLVKDSLEMGLAAAESADIETLLAGKEATLKQLTTVLEQFGVAEIDPAGEPFDPELHEAMTMQPAAESEPGSVLTVIQKGYSLNGRLLRPARVIVAAEPDSGPGDNSAGDSQNGQ